MKQPDIRYCYASGDETFYVTVAGHIGRKENSGYGPAWRVVPSESWRITGAVRYNNFGHVIERRDFPRCMAIPYGELTYKNGKPRWRLCDFDHGAYRVQMMPGVTNIWSVSP